MSPARHNQRYTEEELRIIRWNWQEKTLNEVAAMLGRSPKGLMAKMYTLDQGVRQDSYVTINEAARRAGISCGTLRKILRGKDLKTKPTYSGEARRRDTRTAVRRKGRGVRLIEWDKARDAVSEFYLTQTTVGWHAMTLGCHPTTMKRALMWDGHTPPGMKGSPWRVTVDVATAAFERYHARPKHLRGEAKKC